MREGADLRKLVHHAGDAGQMLADVNAGDVGRDALEIASHLDRGVGLEVERVNRAQATFEEDIDERLVLRGGRGPGGPREQARERQLCPEHACRADAEEVPASVTVTEGRVNVGHERVELTGTPRCHSTGNQSGNRHAAAELRRRISRRRRSS